MKSAELPDESAHGALTSTAAEAGGRDLRELLEAYERGLIVSALETVGGRQRSAAALLRVLPTTLNEKMKRLGIPSRYNPGQASAGGEAVRATLDWKGSVPLGGTLEVRGLNGPVRIEGWDGAEVEVSAVRTGPSGGGSTIEVKIIEHSGGVTVCAVCQGVGATVPRRLTPRASRSAASAKVHIVARVPLGVHVVASTLNDDIEIVGLAGNVEAGTANGRVRFLPAPPPLRPVPQG